MRARSVQMMSVLSILAVVLISSMLCSGCAFGSRAVALNYTPTIKGPDLGGGRPIQISAIRDTCVTNEKSIFAKNGAGQLTTTNGKEIGDIRNGYYIKTASVVSKSMDLGPWVTDALTKELKQRGFSAAQVTALPPACPLGVSGSLTECYSRAKFFSGQECTIRATISILQNGAAISSKEYVGTSKGGVAFLTPAEYEKVFQLAMADFVGKVVKDIAIAGK
jgi:hypothetical protein